QEGILFHHLLNEQGDTYVLQTLLGLSSRAQLDALLDALQVVVDRHDTLRTAVVWKELPKPVQVVYRRAVLPVQTLSLRAGESGLAQMRELMAPQRLRMDLQQAPMLRVQIAAEPQGERWYALLQLHHLAADHVSLEIVLSEVMACMQGGAQQL